MLILDTQRIKSSLTNTILFVYSSSNSHLPKVNPAVSNGKATSEPTLGSLPAVPWSDGARTTEPPVIIKINVKRMFISQTNRILRYWSIAVDDTVTKFMDVCGCSWLLLIGHLVETLETHTAANTGLEQSWMWQQRSLVAIPRPAVESWSSLVSVSGLHTFVMASISHHLPMTTFTLTLPHRLVNLMQGASLSWRVCFNMFKTCSTSICKKPCKVPLDISGSGLSKTFFGRRGGAKCSGLKSYSLNRRSQRSPLDLGKHAANAWRYLKIPLWDIARHLSFCLVNVGRWRRNATTSCSAVGHWIWQCVKTLYPWWTSK